MKSLKFKLKDWNKSVFGDVHLKISNAMQQVDSIQQQVYENGYTEALFDLEKNARLELEKALQFQEAFWHEKSRVKWHLQGDRNTQFFNRTAQVRNATKQMSC